MFTYELEAMIKVKRPPIMLTLEIDILSLSLSLSLCSNKVFVWHFTRGVETCPSDES